MSSSVRGCPSISGTLRRSPDLPRALVQPGNFSNCCCEKEHPVIPQRTVWRKECHGKCRFKMRQERDYKGRRLIRSWDVCREALKMHTSSHIGASLPLVAVSLAMPVLASETSSSACKATSKPVTIVTHVISPSLCDFTPATLCSPAQVVPVPKHPWELHYLDPVSCKVKAQVRDRKKQGLQTLPPSVPTTPRGSVGTTRRICFDSTLPFRESSSGDDQRCLSVS